MANFDSPLDPRLKFAGAVIEVDDINKYPTFNKVLDSGKREDFNTGSVRDTREGKGRFDLIPPVVLRRLAQHYENGARKYGDRNWEKGQPLSRYYDSAMRHMLAWLEGRKDEDHASAVLWNFAAIIHHEETLLNKIPELFDAGPYKVTNK